MILMKYLKMLGIVVAAIMVLMAFAGAASATVLTSPAGTQYKGELVFTGNSSLLWRLGFANITCTESSVAGTPTNFGGAASTVSLPVSTLTLHSCNATVTVLKKGTLEIHTIGAGPNGTVTWSGTEVTYASGGVSCTYGTNNTSVGTLTGSNTTGGSAMWDVKASLFKVAGGFLCASPAAWEGSYVVTKPAYLDVS
jgi:hypothetical protein